MHAYFIVDGLQKQLFAEVGRGEGKALLSLSQDAAPGIFAEFMGLETTTLKDWVAEWEKQRMLSLFSGYAANLNRSFLTEDQLETATQVLSPPPWDYYLSTQFLDVLKLNHRLSTKFNV